MSEITETNPDRTRELGKDAQEVLTLFHQAKASFDPKKRLGLLRKMADKLAVLIDDPGKNFPVPDNNLDRLILNGVNPNSDYLPIGTGTSGERVYFLSRHPESNLKSSDGKVRWMFYPWNENKKFGRIYYERFLNQFGTDIVDLLGEGANEQAL